MTATQEHYPINLPLLKKTLAYIESHPKKWNQHHWRYGTSYCFGGHAARIANGGRLPFDNVGKISDKLIAAKWSTLDEERTAFGGSDIEDEAMYALELGETTARILFRPENTLDQLRSMVQDLCELDMSKQADVSKFTERWQHVTGSVDG